jgi:pyridoxamine 5'-phosphate oxidase
VPPSGLDPIARVRRWLRFAERAGAPLPNAAALATAAPRGRPSVRFVLVKGLDVRGLVFFTDARSQKGRDLVRNPRAAVALYWDAIGRQVRIEGRVTPIAVSEADAYWALRPRASRLAARASCQSAPLANRAVLLRRWRLLSASHDGRDISRPRHWTGFRLSPGRIEIWTRRAHRLHERELFVRAGGGWRRRLLQP